MLGRRRVTRSPQFIDLAERIRQRALGNRTSVIGTPANDSGRFTKRGPEAVPPPSPRDRPGKLLAFDDTPVYRITERTPISADALHQVLAVLEDRLDCVTALDGSRANLAYAVNELIEEVLVDLQLRLSHGERSVLTERLLDDLAGFGPLELLLRDATVSEITVDGPDRVHIERRGRRQRTDVTFRSAAHLMRIARRIALGGACRLDESCPVAHVQLEDGGRACVMVPPLAMDGVSITIRKPGSSTIPLHQMVRQNNLSRAMAVLLVVAALSRLNILISGCRGSGCTTLLNALLERVDPAERLICIEQSAELHLPQPHAVRLETRPMTPSGLGEITQRDLLRNALRMRPDRIILGELQDKETLDLLVALNSGHQGAMATVHAKRPGDALNRLEAMMSVGGGEATQRAYRSQIAQGVDLLVQVEQMRDGLRRVTHITEVVGIEDDEIVTRDLFTFEYGGEDENGRVLGDFKATGIKPAFAERVAQSGMEAPLKAALRGRSSW